MDKKLDPEWVKRVATELEPIFKFMDHTWRNSINPPTADEIASTIQELWRDLKEDDMEVGGGGLHVSTSEEGEPVVIYRKEIVFSYDGGESYSV